MYPYNPNVCRCGMSNTNAGITVKSSLLSRTNDFNAHSLFKSKKEVKFVQPLFNPYLPYPIFLLLIIPWGRCLMWFLPNDKYSSFDSSRRLLGKFSIKFPSTNNILRFEHFDNSSGRFCIRLFINSRDSRDFTEPISKQR